MVMEVNKKNRAELKRFFVKNALPTESNFADLIDAALNQKDDGLVKPVGDALSIESAGMSKAALRFYESFTDANAAWTLGVQDNTMTTVPKGFTVSDRAGNTRLFVNSADGTVSVGALTASGNVTTGALSASGAVSANLGLTVTGAALNVGTGVGNAQRLTVWGPLTANSGLTVTGAAASVGSSTNVQPLTVWGALSANSGLNVTGAAVNIGTSASTAQPLTVWGALTANGGLTVRGGLTVDSISTSSAAGASFPALTTTGLLSATLGLTVTGAAVNVGTSPANAQPLNVWGALTANSGLNVTGAAVNIGTSANVQPLTVWGALSANGGIQVKGSLALDSLTAATPAESPSIAIAPGVELLTNRLTARGTINVTQGLVVTGAPATVGSPTAPQPLTVHGALTANAGLTVNGGALNVGSLAVPQPLNVSGRLTATSTVNLTPPPRSGVRLDRSFNQYLGIGPTSVSFSSGFTIQAWVYVTAYGQFTRILDFGNGQSDNVIFGIDSDGLLFGQVYKGTVAGTLVRLSGFSGGRVPLSTWTHVAFSVDQSGSAKMYIRGNQFINFPSDATLIPNNVGRNNNYLGRSSTPSDAFFSGFLAEVSLWVGALPASSITTASPTGTESGLVAYWKMNETSGSVAFNTITTFAVGHAGVSATTGVPPTFATAFDRVQQTTISQEEWTTPTLNGSLAGSWRQTGTGCNPPGFFKDSLGIVHLRGFIGFSSQVTLVEGRDNAISIMNLPAGYRPLNKEVLSCLCSNAAGRVDVYTDGTIYLISGNSTSVSLDGLTFRAAQ